MFLFVYSLPLKTVCTSRTIWKANSIYRSYHWWNREFSASVIQGSYNKNMYNNKVTRKRPLSSLKERRERLKGPSFQSSFSCLILFSFSGRPESSNSCRRNARINNDRSEPRNNHSGLYRSGWFWCCFWAKQSRWQTGLFQVSVVNSTISNLIILIYLLVGSFSTRAELQLGAFIIKFGEKLTLSLMKTHFNNGLK